MNLYEAIAIRRSTRTYTPRPIDLPVVRELQQSLTRLPRPWHGDCGVRIAMWQPESISAPLPTTYGVVSGAARYLVLLANDLSDRCQMAGGYAMEYAVLQATALRLDTCWLGGTLHREQFVQGVNANADEKIVAVSPVGYGAAKPRWRDRLMRGLAGSDGRKPFAQLFFDADGAPYPEDGRLADAFRAVRRAPSASNSQPWRLVAMPDGKVRFYASMRGSKRFMLNDIGIAMAHFAIAYGHTCRWSRDEYPDHSVVPDAEYILTMHP